MNTGEDKGTMSKRILGRKIKKKETQCKPP
jgi:hypothetical protein